MKFFPSVCPWYALTTVQFQSWSLQRNLRGFWLMKLMYIIQGLDFKTSITKTTLAIFITWCTFVYFIKVLLLMMSYFPSYFFISLFFLIFSFMLNMYKASDCSQYKRYQWRPFMIIFTKLLKEEEIMKEANLRVKSVNFMCGYN